jgi:hypothetical protein
MVYEPIVLVFLLTGINQIAQFGKSLLPNKGENEQPGQGKRICVPELTKTNGHAFVTCLWLITIGPKQAVPPG